MSTPCKFPSEKPGKVQSGDDHSDAPTSANMMDSLEPLSLFKTHSHRAVRTPQPQLRELSHPGTGTAILDFSGKVETSVASGTIALNHAWRCSQGQVCASLTLLIKTLPSFTGPGWPRVTPPFQSLAPTTYRMNRVALVDGALKIRS